MSGEPQTSVEELRVTAWSYFLARHFEEALYQVRSGMVTSEEWEGFRGNLKLIAQTQPFRDYWEREKEIYSSAFQQESSDIHTEIDRDGPFAPASLVVSSSSPGDKDEPG